MPVEGRPSEEIEELPGPRRVGIVAADHIGLVAVPDVEVGEKVRRGQPLFHDRRAADIPHTAPAAGRVVAIERGGQRRLLSIVLERAEDDSELQHPFAALEGPPSDDPARIRALLQQSGLWTFLRARPFSRIPSADAPSPRAIFVNAMDSHPLAPRPERALEGRENDFARGLSVLRKLTEGELIVCRARGSRLGEGSSDVRIEELEGPHPVGTVGLHIHLFQPVDRHRVVWHIGYSAVAAIGALFARGELDTRCVIALAGPGARRPRLIRTLRGADLLELTRGELFDGQQRVISGSPLSGRALSDPREAFLGHYHQQVTVLPEGGEREFLGWLRPGLHRFSALRAFLPFGRKSVTTTSVHGSMRALIPIDAYERVMPMDLLPAHLLRALLVGDLEMAEELGCLELDEEDLALCSFVCPGKIEYGPYLRRVLDAIEDGE